MSSTFRIRPCLLLFAALVAGCDDGAEPAQAPPQTPADLASAFDPSTAGTLEGRVTWEGALPQVPPFHAPVSPGMEHGGSPRRDWPNPNAPRIDANTKAVAGAVVFLRGVEVRRSRPWDHPPVRVELRDYRIQVRQGNAIESCGFVQRGASITMVSRQDVFQSLQVRGAAFFSRAFADRDHPCTQRLDRAGAVELASGCGHFWMRGHLLVADHPYYTRTDAGGRFMLPQVPPGAYELVCWMPHWHEAEHERDAETALVCRLAFRPPVEIVQPVRLEPRERRTVAIGVPAERFGR